ncbi:hypothetical protein CR164_03805 [Prosthecochloris marina]|uniref:Uncharacterized protein n=1 Tax=Prosthecochloris marina TaxID=2017681 RepID=A0A317TAY6_9CHLB|nr:MULTISPECIES: hypothetical protein [Prosthecochloris]PWW82871.1 hypothetical protein CR164_03805 [Prosthecochloris marina]UZJ38848.1 hypothetical protein OO005_01145 [Prosthecochloris sp. SCSIO W1103]
MVSDDFNQVLEEPNFNNPNTSPDPPSPYADLEKRYRKNKFNKKKNYYPELFGTQGVDLSERPSNSGNKVRKKKASKPKRKPSSKANRLRQGKQNPNT